MSRSMLFVLAGVAMLAGAVPAFAVPQVLQYQGRLTDAAGAPLTGPVDVTFAIHAQPEGGTPLWTQRFEVLALDNGRFSVLLGGAWAPFTPELSAALRAGTDLHLGITVGGDAEMSPRQPIAAVMYALQAGFADSAGHARSSDHARTADMAIGDHARSADTASYARASGHARTADMAIGEHAGSADTASYARRSGWSLTADEAEHADDANHAEEADHAEEAGHAEDADHADLSDRATTADFSVRATRADSAAYTTRAGQAARADTAAYAVRAGRADTADLSVRSSRADSATHARTSDHAATADVALSQHAATADTASHARTSDHARTADIALSQQVYADSAGFAHDSEHARTADDVASAPGIAFRSVYREPTYPGQVTSLVSATITTPAPGYILVVATGSMALDNTLGAGVRCYVNVAEDTSATQSTMGRIVVEVPVADLGEHYFPFTCQRVYPKPAGTYTFFLNIRNFSTIGKVTTHRPTITTLFVPNVYGTAEEDATDPVGIRSPR